MAIAISHPTGSEQQTDWIEVAHELGPRFAEREAAHDANDTFVAQNYVELE